MIWFLENGYWPNYLDHINHNRLDNRIENLRECSHLQNLMNVPKRARNKSGYKGVSWHQNNCWVAHITLYKKNIYLGSFVNIIDAAKAYDVAATKHFGEFAYRNFP